jgi:hypothetical protein
MANMKDYPVQSRKCGAHCRTTGQPCRTWAMPNGKCKMHGGKSPGAPRGAKHPNWQGGKYSHEGLELRKGLRAMRRDGEALLAVSLDAHGLSRKIPKVLRRRTHIRRARAEAKKAKEQK